MKKTYHWSRILGITFFLVLSGVAGRLIFPPFSNLSKELPVGNFTASELFQEFTSDPTGAYILLANKVIILEGEVAATGDGYVMVGKDIFLVRCMFRKSIYDRKPGLKTGDRVTLKGICRGLNMTEVLITHCIIINKPTN